jgi:hypothetical protein
MEGSELGRRTAEVNHRVTTTDERTTRVRRVNANYRSPRANGFARSCKARAMDIKYHNIESIFKYSAITSVLVWGKRSLEGKKEKMYARSYARVSSSTCSDTLCESKRSIMNW